MPRLFIISGCNGAGKTTASFTILPEVLGCEEFLNADEIARGLSPFHPEGVAREAGRIMLARADQLFASGTTFAFETTLASRSHAARIRKARELGYEVILIFFWLDSEQLAIERVAQRVREGGHNIPTTSIRRRYRRGLINLFRLYLPAVDHWQVFNNSGFLPELVAQGSPKNKTTIFAKRTWQKIQNQLPPRTS